MATFEYYGLNADSDSDTLCSIFDIKTTLPDQTFYLYYENLGVNFSETLYEDYYAYFGYGEKNGTSYKHKVGALTEAPVFDVEGAEEFTKFKITADNIDETKTASKIRIYYRFDHDILSLGGQIVKAYVDGIYVFPIQFHPITLLSFSDYILYSSDVSHDIYLVIEDAFDDCPSSISPDELPDNYTHVIFHPSGNINHLFINYSNTYDINNFIYTNTMNEYVHYDGNDILSTNKSDYSIQITHCILYKSNESSNKFMITDIESEDLNYIKLYNASGDGNFKFISNIHFQHDDGGSLYYYFV